jgi:rubrerythrin
MEFNKPPEWGSRFQFPENQKFDFDDLQMRVTNKIITQMIDDYETAVASEIASAARAAGVSDVTVLNKKAIMEALERRTPKKPKEDGWLYCPVCGKDVLQDHVRFCPDCGQAIDWRDA